MFCVIRGRVEGRTWYSSHRGRLWIAAAGKRPTPQEISQVEASYRTMYKRGKPEQDLMQYSVTAQWSIIIPTLVYKLSRFVFFKRFVCMIVGLVLYWPTISTPLKNIHNPFKVLLFKMCLLNVGSLSEKSELPCFYNGPTVRMWPYLFFFPVPEFPKEYPTGCLLGCVNMADCLSQEQFREQVSTSCFTKP